MKRIVVPRKKLCIGGVFLKGLHLGGLARVLGRSGKKTTFSDALTGLSWLSVWFWAHAVLKAAWAAVTAITFHGSG